MVITKEMLMKNVDGYSNGYVTFVLIGENITPESVVNMLNKLYEQDEDMRVGDGHFDQNGHYNMLSFTAMGEGNIDDVYRMTEELHCIGYADVAWCDDIVLFCARDGKPYSNGFTVNWAEGMPDDREEDDEDGTKYWDCFVTITDKTSGFEFESGQGCVDDDAMEAIQQFIDEHYV